MLWLIHDQMRATFDFANVTRYDIRSFTVLLLSQSSLMLNGCIHYTTADIVLEIGSTSATVHCAPQTIHFYFLSSTVKSWPILIIFHGVQHQEET